MVLSRNDKRKRKEGDLVDLMDPLAEPPKRTKIHAQRKFAQGVATPVYSPVTTPIKEQKEQKAKPGVFTELITHKRPNTEDFLTFLCFRGTSILPPSLNFFSDNNKKDKQQDAVGSAPSTNGYAKTNGTCSKSAPSSKADHQLNGTSTQKAASKEKTANVPKKQAPTAVPKTIKLKTTTTAIQALKKKYQEQRLAKQRLKKKFKPSCMKTRSCATVVERAPVEKPVVTKVAAPKKILSRIESRRHGLRSTGIPESEKKSLPLKTIRKSLVATKLKKKAVAAKDDASSVDSFPVKTNVKKPAPKTASSKLIQKKTLDNKKKKKIAARRVTRSRVDIQAAKSPTPTNPTRRPTRKTKEAAAVYMEILGRKLVSPELENEDNLSLDSFPELPNARKIAQTENEIKAKVKSLKAAATINAATAAMKEKEKKLTSSASNGSTKPVKRKVVKQPLPLKNKRLVKVQKYCELNSDDESVSSKESIEETKAVATRRSASTGVSKVKKAENRTLRSSRSLTSKKSCSKTNETEQTSINELAKSTKNTESQNPSKSNKETNDAITKESGKETPKEKMTAASKRKRDSIANDKDKDKDMDKDKEKEKESSTAKQKPDAVKNKSKTIDAAVESDEESLFNKMKKRKEAEKEECNQELLAKKTTEPKTTKTTAVTTTSTKSTTVETLKSQAEAPTTKMSDDEESFRGFTKKAISKVANTCQSLVKASGLLDDIDSKANILSSSASIKDVKKVDIKIATGTFPCKGIVEQMLNSGGATSSAANASVKLEPDFGDLKPPKPSKVSTSVISSLTPASGLHSIIDMPKALPHHGRKERVNMSTEQIEKWLNESSLAKEESKVEMESVGSFKFDLPLDKPIAKSSLDSVISTSSILTTTPTISTSTPPTTPAIPPPPAAVPASPALSLLPTHGHLSISPKIQHLVRPVNVTLSKLSDRLKRAPLAQPLSGGATHKMPSVFLAGSHISPVKPQLPVASKAMATTGDAATSASNRGKPKDSLQQLPQPPPQQQKLQQQKPQQQPQQQQQQQQLSSALSSRKMSKDSSCGDDVAADSDAVSKSDAASSVGGESHQQEKKSLSGSPEKKVFFHQRAKQPFLHKERVGNLRSSSSSAGTAAAASWTAPAVTTTQSAGNAAFSPENESSVYAFESELEAPVSTPFRRRARESNISSSNNVAKDHSRQAGTTDKEKSLTAHSTNSEAKSKSEEAKKVTEPLNSPEEARKEEEKSSPLLERTTPKNFELPKNFADLTNIQVLPLDKLTTSWSNVNCSASIAVQVNLDEQKQQDSKRQQSSTAEGNNVESNAQKSTEISTQTDSNADNDDDDSGQLFYIPLQAVTRNASAQGGQQLIQGVAVKLGTEGPTGPNQRVLLKAKLVTKPPISVARCPPIGTVQPTARTPQHTSADQTDLPSTSTFITADASFKFPMPEEKVDRAIGNKEIHKTSSSEKVMKSPKSRERKTSMDGGKGGKRGKAKSMEIHSPVNKTSFPNTKDSKEEPRLVEAPTFRPSEKDFQDPLEYIDKIRPIAEKFGICKVIPPSNFKPECKVSDDMRFTAYNHYVHRMLHRWGPNVKEMMAIRKYLATQSITLTQPPWIGGMEVDLPHLYQTVQNLGGLKEVIEKKKWQKVADGMKIPKSAQDRVTKLDDIYCKYLLPYDTLSQDERDKLFKDVEADWARRERRERQEVQSNDDDDDDEDSSEEIEECIVKGRNMPLNAFYRIARNTLRMWFGENQRSTGEMEGAPAEDVETAFWKHVAEKKRHVCVHAASIDTCGRGFGFSVAKNSPFGRHPWNLKILTNNAGSVLRALGPQMGVTVPTLHVGMLFSACCWYRDPHGLPWIEYLHTGAKKIWYGIPDDQSSTLRQALTKMFPRYCKNKKIWLPSDTAMVPPDMLVSNGVPLCQTVQEPGQFIIVFPKAFTSSICTGYVVSESVYFAQPSWLETAEQVFQDLHDSCEPSIFSFERLLFSIINDSRSHIDILKQILPTVIKVCDKEIENRRKLKEIGLANIEKLPLPENDKKKGKKVKEEESDYECDTCRANLFVSLVSNPTDESIFCLTHAIPYIEKKKQVLKNCKLMYTYSESELNDLIRKLKDRIEAKSKKTNQTKAK